jgi:hypothetical protein
MAIIDDLKKLLQRAADPPRKTQLIYLHLPLDIEPGERWARYEDPLNEELQARGLGYVSGGGTMQSARRPDGSQETLFVGVDVDAYDLDRTRAHLWAYLPGLGCPAGTKLQFQAGDRDLEDAYDGATWTVGRTP